LRVGVRASLDLRQVGDLTSGSCLRKLSHAAARLQLPRASAPPASQPRLLPTPAIRNQHSEGCNFPAPKVVAAQVAEEPVISVDSVDTKK
jgi:hypothetical protein